MVTRLKYCFLFGALMCQAGARADSLAASDALRQLIERQPAVVSSPASSAGANGPSASTPAGRHQEQTKANETLDSVIKRTWPGLPTKDVWVRKTFVDLNPQAFVQGNPNLMVAGTTLTIPSQADLRASFTAAHPKIAALFGPVPAESTERQDHGHDPGKGSNKWVRFP